MDVMTVPQWATAVVVALGGIAAALRKYSKTHLEYKEDNSRIEANNQLLANLNAEISRLHGVVQELNKRIGDLEDSINSLRNLEIAGATDFGALEMVIQGFPCQTCTNQGETFEQMRDVMERLRKRRERRYSILGVEEPE